MLTVALSLRHISKVYYQTSALSNVSFKINQGRLAAVIGPNGSGKTTLIKLIVGLELPTKGRLTVFGINSFRDPLAIRRIIGYVPDNPSGFDYLTGAEFLRLKARLNLISPKYDNTITQLLDDLRLTKLLDQRLCQYSRGSRQKLSYVAALLPKPKLLLVDEPIVGLDPESIEVFGDSLKSFTKRGGTAMFSTHILEFGKRFGNHLLLIKQGKLIHQGPITQKTSLTKKYAQAGN